MKQVPRDLIEEIRNRSDVVDVLGSYIRLIRAGSRFKALCPFHKEKTPSFHVNPQMQAYHCFGCGAGGDVFRFVMEHEGVDFMTAVRLLAHRAGIPVVLDDDGRESVARDTKDALYRVHEDLTAFYHDRLLHAPDAEAARAYLAERDLVGEAMERFRFGYAPATPGALREWARKRKITPTLLQQAGVLATGESGGRTELYDRFRSRLMIPICDELGRVIGFTGRVLRAEDSPAKYVNSPETPLFRKSRVLFGLDRARTSIVEARQAILCEGQLDTIRCHVAGIERAVAAQGTAVTEDHARILARYADEVALVLDPDEAGRRAALRSAQVLAEAGLAIRVAVLPDGEDPDVLIRRGGAAALLERVNNAQTAMAFLVGEMERAGELATQAGMARAARAAIELAGHAAGAVQREQMLREASALLGVSEASLRRDFRPRRTRSYPADTQEQTAAEETPDPPEEIALLEAMLAADAAREEVRHYLPTDRLASARCRTGIEALLRGGPEALRAEAAASNDADLARLVGRILVSSRLSSASADEVPALNVARELIARIWRRRLEEQRISLRLRVREASGTEAREHLALERAELSMRLSKMNRGWDAARSVIEAELDEEDAEA